MNTNKAMSDRTGLEIAVIGLAGRFPGARDTAEFWENLKSGIESISFFSDQELEESGTSALQLKSSDYVKAKGFLQDIEYFDASFFGYAPFEAELMDPQVRFFHECSWEALEDAGYAPDAYEGLIGVYAGASTSFRWEGLSLLAGKTRQVDFLEGMSLTNKDFLCTRLSYRLNLKGPSSFVQTACSTSLVAVHLACRALLAGECHMALAGGVTISNYSRDGYVYKQDMILSPDGHNRTFDEDAKGTVPSNGIGIVVLKWLKNAIKDRDNIYAIIKGSAINNDGKRKVGYMAPSVEGQAEAIHRALAMARVEPESIGYLEAHGTATVLGDPVEIEALKLAFNTDKKRFCGIGSVKSNIGHLDSAAGVAGLIKAVLALKHRLLPPSLHFTRPNPEIDFENSPFYVVTRLIEWERQQYPLRAGVSSFGIGGTNAHVILEEFPGKLAPLPEVPAARNHHLVLLSAKTETALTQMTENLAEHFKKNPTINLADAAYTLQVGRQDFPFRWMTVCSDRDNAIAILCSKERGNARSFQALKDKKVIFMLPGLGSQYVNMGLDLYKTEPLFRNEIDCCREILNSLVDYDIKEIMYPSGSDHKPARASHDIDRFDIAQLAIFVLEYALAKLILKWGISPHAMIGYSFGEYTAACLSGVLSLEDALKTVVARGKLIAQLPPGAMLSVPLPAADIKPLLTGYDGLTIAIDNGSSSIIAGEIEKVAAFEKEMRSKRYVCTGLPASHALHSPMMEPIVEEYEKIIARVTLNKPRVPYISNITGTWINSEQVVKPAYWVKHLRETVRFADGIKELVKDKNVVFIEIGPGRDLSSLVMRYIEKDRGQSALDLIRHPAKEISDVSFLLDRIGRLWLQGVKPDWKSVYGDEKRYRITLPTYPFEGQTYWYDKDALKRNTSSLAGSPQANDAKSLLYVPSWQPTGIPAALPGENLAKPGMRRLMFISEADFSLKLVKKMKSQGEAVYCVQEGTEFEQVDEFNYTINPRNKEDYHSLLRHLHTPTLALPSIVHLWGINRASRPELAGERMNQPQELLLYSLLHLAQAIGDTQPGEDKQIRITVVTNNMHTLPGEEILCPEKAPILAAIKMIPQLYTNIRCRGIDIVVPSPGTRQEEELIEHLSTELMRDTIHPVVAFRGHERLHQTFTPVPLADANPGNATTLFKERGVYMIIGEPNGAAGEIAQYLAPLVKPKLLFIRNPVSDTPEKEGQEHFHLTDMNLTGELKEDRQPSGILAEEIDFLNSQQEIFEKQFEVKGIETYTGLEQALNELCTCSILDYFHRNSITVEEGKGHDLEDLRKRLQILPEFYKFFDFFIAVLLEDQMIAVENNKVNFLKAAALYKDPSILAKEIAEKYPEFSGTIRAIDHCRRYYSDALSGKIEAIGVLFPDGNYLLGKAEYQDSVKHTYNSIYFSMFREFVLNFLNKMPPDKKVRILEIGGERGLLTRVLIPVLKGLKVEYHFTDVGKFFVINARKEAANQQLDFMEFDILDLSRDPAEQGREYNSYDMIVGLNMGHTSRSIEESLKNVKKLLSPGGLLCLLEYTNPKRWLNMIDGFAEGWWYYEDDRIDSHSPLMSLDTWEHFFKKVGFADAISFPRDTGKRAFTDYGIIIGSQEREAQREGNRESNRGARGAYLECLEKAGAEVRTIAADLTDIEALRREVARVESSWGSIHGIIQYIDNVAEKNGGGENLVEKVEPMLETGIKCTLALDDIFRTRPPDFHAICSTRGKAADPAGNIGSAAVLHFSDSYARYKRSTEGRLVVSMNWDPSVTETSGDLFTSILLHRFSQVIVTPEAPTHVIARIQGDTDQKKEKKEKKTDAVLSKKYRRREVSSEYTPPTNRIEETLANFWQEFLGIEQVGIYDDFLELGADSLVFITMAAKIHKTMEIKVPIPQFFAKPTIKELAAYIEGLNKDIFTTIEPAEKKEYYPLSSLQERLFLLDRMGPPGNTSYNLPLVLRVEGDVEIEKFEDISRKIIRRHESLRTSFTIINDLPAQIIRDDADFNIYVPATAPGTNGASAQPVEVTNFISPFDLSRPPLLRIVLLKEEEQNYSMLVDMHHIITDGVSLNIFARDFMSLYIDKQLSPIKIQYKDYAQWLNSEKGIEARHREASYWYEQFSNERGVPILKLPTDFARPQVQSFEGASIGFNIGQADARGVNTLASEHGTTLFVVLLAVFNVFLYRITHQEAIVVGTATAGRRHADLETILGMFVNTLGILNFPRGDLSFKEFLRDVSDNTWKAFENQDYPFEELVEHVLKDRDPSRNPLFDVSLVFENLKGENIEIPGLKFKRKGVVRHTSQVDLSMLIFEKSEGFFCLFEYCTKLFKESTILEFETYYRNVLSAILDNTDILLKDIEITHGSDELEKNIFEDDLGDF